MALLHVDRGDKQGQIIKLDQDSMILGRSPDCQLVISKNDAVSRWHARIMRVNDRYFIEDMKSRNKTYVNDKEVPVGTQALLNHKDSIRICQFQATFLETLPEAEDLSSSTVEAMLSSKSDHRLDTQPAAKLAILLEITAKLSKTLNLDAQLPEVVAGLLKLFPQADRCFLILADQETGELQPKVVRARGSNVNLTGATFSHTIVRQCLTSAHAILWREGDTPNTPGIDSVIAAQMRSVMCVPLCPAEGDAFGVIQLDTQDNTKRFTEDDLRLLWGVSFQASIAMESARYHELRLAQVRVKNELEMAGQVQRNFLPQSLPQLAGYEFYAYYKAAREVGGDYYDFIFLPDQRVAVTIGDVAGKGMPAALLMARLSSDARSCFLTERDLTAAIAKLNQQLHPITNPMDRFVTLAAAILDPAAHRLTLINAGHPSPLVYRRATSTLTKAIADTDTGSLLGIADTWQAQCFEMTLEPGDCVLLFSDGVIDAQSVAGRSFRTSGVYNVLSNDVPGTPQGIGERVVRAVESHSVGGSQYDDITLICFGRPIL